MQPVFISEHVRQNKTRPVKNSLNKWCTSAQLTTHLSLHGYCKRENLLIITVVAKTLPQRLINNLSRIDFRPCSTGTPSPPTSIPQRATISKWACDLCAHLHTHTVVMTQSFHRLFRLAENLSISSSMRVSESISFNCTITLFSILCRMAPGLTAALCRDVFNLGFIEVFQNWVVF